MPGPAADVPTFTVGELNRLIRYALSVTFPDEVWVEGEISSLKRHEASGNVYFQLVDGGDGESGGAQADACVAVVLRRASKEAVNRLLKRARTTDAAAVAGGPATPSVRMADGVQIRIRGSIEYAPRQGRLQLRMTAIDPSYTLGRIAAERDRVLAALAAEGLLGRNGALPLPLLPTRLGLVTSDGSAAQADFLHELETSGIGWRVTLVASRVQGIGADVEVAAALRRLERHGVDVIALVRGGGARTDLMAFDSEHLARTIAGLRVPVVTGIGHEIDTSVADALAAVAYKTPTACAAALVDAARAAIDRPEQAWARIGDGAGALLDSRSLKVAATGRRVAFAGRIRLDGHQARIDTGTARLAIAAPMALSTAARRLDTVAARVDAGDPQRLLDRGWSITRTAAGTVLRDPARLRPGDRLFTTVQGGSVVSEVSEGTTSGPWPGPPTTTEPAIATVTAIATATGGSR